LREISVNRPSADTTKATEALKALWRDGRAEVDEPVARAAAAGATTPNAPHDSAEALAARYHSAWQRLWQGMGAAPADMTLLQALVARYTEPHRKYHTLQHLDACFRHFAGLRDQAGQPDEIEVALWFHDAIYAIRAPDNEQKSADWARAALLAGGAGTAAADRVHALVMVTRHDCAPQTPDQEILLDVDLSILGTPPPVFDAYEVQVRDEYRLVPLSDWRANRRRILQGFLQRPRIYHTASFNSRFEAQARANLQRSIAALAG